MCAVSVIIAYGQNIPPYEWNKFRAQEIVKVIDQAREFDRVTGEPDCSDPDKEAWEKWLREEYGV